MKFKLVKAERITYNYIPAARLTYCNIGCPWEPSVELIVHKHDYAVIWDMIKDKSVEQIMRMSKVSVIYGVREEVEFPPFYKKHVMGHNLSGYRDDEDHTFIITPGTLVCSGGGSTPTLFNKIGVFCIIYYDENGVQQFRRGQSPQEVAQRKYVDHCIDAELAESLGLLEWYKLCSMRYASQSQRLRILRTSNKSATSPQHREQQQRTLSVLCAVCSDYYAVLIAFYTLLRPANTTHQPPLHNNGRERR